jgi:toxin secretion/phage lysis holin
MKKMKMFDFMDAYNSLLGAIIASLTMIFGKHWFLFAFFLVLNIIDWITGWMKSRMAGKENSVKGWQGVLKKLGYWLMIAFGFGIAACLIEVGSTIGVDLQITTILGWFVLASLIVNEARSIVENFVEAGFNVPMILQNGLEVADKLINKENESE